MKRFKTDPRLWAGAILAAIGLVLLEKFLPSAFWLAWNLLILLLGFLLALLILGQRYSIAIAAVALVAGLMAHWFAYSRAISKGVCARADATGWIDGLVQIDNCLDYSASWVVEAQAVIIAATIVLAIKAGTLLRQVLQRTRRY